MNIKPLLGPCDYIESWLEVLKHDKRFIFTAASQAQKAADYLQAKMGEVN